MRNSSILFLALVGCSQDTTISGKLQQGPAVTIQAPEDGEVSSTNQAVELVGLVVDGNGLDDIRELTWASDIDGDLADLAAAPLDADGVTRHATTLSVGVHALSLTVTDIDGLSADEIVSVTIEEADTAPVVEITLPEDFARFDEGSPINLIGSVSDPNQDAETLTVVWGYTDEAGGYSEILAQTPSPTGAVSAVWKGAPVGEQRVSLLAIDDDDHRTEVVVLVEVLDPTEADRDQDGWPASAGDCDDDDPDVHPGADEACNLIDDDCNDVVDDKDLDGDTHVDQACLGYTGPLAADDCDDLDPLSFPGAVEQLDDADNDCNGIVDDGLSTYDEDGDCYCSAAYCTGSANPACATVDPGDCNDGDATLNLDDLDADGYSTCDGDCDDDDPTLDAADRDNDTTTTCDGDCDDDDPLLNSLDTDGDGFTSCQLDCNDGNPDLNPRDLDLDGFSTCTGDCNDSDASLTPVDNDGDGYSRCDNDCDDDDPTRSPEDGDLDGLSGCAGDCDDSDPTQNQLDSDSDGFSTCDGDCNDGVSGQNLRDDDGDGTSSCTGDCNDNDPALHGRDDDGDGYSTCELDCNDGDPALSPADLDGDGSSTCSGDCDDANNTLDGLDADNDGVTTCDGDCDDNQGLAYPGNTEVPYNGIDDDCLFGDETDVDNDGWVAVEAGGPDCDDDDGSVNPAATESCNGKDDDCNEGVDEDNTWDCTVYRYDFDNDGFGTASQQCSCNPDGFYRATEAELDCYDLEADAHPDQLGFFLDHRGDGSWDYDCDGVETLYYHDTRIWDCELSGGIFGGANCSYDVGWVGSRPDCGESQEWNYGCYWIPYVECSPHNSSYDIYDQSCR